MKKDIEVKTNKSKNGYKVATIILSIIVVFLLIANISQTIIFYSQGVEISYNGISYSNDQAYINIYVENKSVDQTLIAYNNFCIKSDNSNALTPDTMYYLDSNSTMHQDLEYYVNSGGNVRIKLNYDKDEIPNNASLYYNGKKIANL